MLTAEAVKMEARRLGFDLVGVAEAAPLEPERSRLQEWLAEHREAGMAWMKGRAEERSDPRKVLPGARAVVVVARNYYAPVSRQETASTGKISRYAWGEDYHRVVLAHAKTLARWIEEHAPGARALAYVDTGPLMEKALAARAGIGWQGKHTNLINEKRGSWFFLGAILTTVALDVDAPAADHCGSCTRCLDACPTQAFPAPYVLDANRCISYLTIEHRGPIPPDLPTGLDGWIFGCDVCQDVCPWNEKFARPTDEPAFLPREGFVNPDLRAWAAIDQEEFTRRFAGSPVRRARWEGLLRNIACVLHARNPTG